MNEKRNLILAVIFSIAILVGYQFYIGGKYPPSPDAQQQGEPAGETAKGGVPSAPTAPGESQLPTVPGASPPAAKVAVKDRETVLAEGLRIKISSPRLRGSIALTGGLIDDLTLVGYHEKLDPESDEIVFLSPIGAADTYYARFGWVRDSGIEVPTPETVWRADGDTLSPTSPVTLTWDNGQGLKFSQTYALD